MKGKNYSSYSREKFFHFSASQKRGMFILLLLMVLVIIGFFIYPYIVVETAQTDFSDFEKQIADYEAGIKEVTTTRKQYQFNYGNVNRSFSAIQLNPFSFDPNTLSEEGWKELGLRPKQIQTIQNYLSKGGKFRKKEDFSKMYCISEDEYKILAPYITIQGSNAGKSFTEFAEKTNSSAFPAKILINMNTADTLEIQELKGIGPAFAKRIVKYRQLLGGFYMPDQLLEVYGFTSEMLSKIQGHISIDSKQIQKININTATVEKLKSHPYVGDWKVAKAIVKYRENFQPFSTVEDLRKVNLITDSVYEKLKPYVSVE